MGSSCHALTPAAHRYEKEFENVQDVFELQRNLNNAFAYDLVPSPSVVIAALRAARRVNDFPTAVRIFEGTLWSAATPNCSGVSGIRNCYAGITTNISP